MIEIESDSVKVKIEASQLADAFWSMGDDEQAVFFNQLGKHTGGLNFTMQMYSMHKCGILTKDGRCAMLHIGEFGAG
jgi:hypothetical protein